MVKRMREGGHDDWDSPRGAHRGGPEIRVPSPGRCLSVEFGHGSAVAVTGAVTGGLQRESGPDRRAGILTTVGEPRGPKQGAIAAGGDGAPRDRLASAVAP